MEVLHHGTVAALNIFPAFYRPSYLCGLANRCPKNDSGRWRDLLATALLCADTGPEHLRVAGLLSVGMGYAHHEELRTARRFAHQVRELLSSETRYSMMRAFQLRGTGILFYLAGEVAIAEAVSNTLLEEARRLQDTLLRCVFVAAAGCIACYTGKTAAVVNAASDLIPGSRLVVMLLIAPELSNEIQHKRREMVEWLSEEGKDSTAIMSQLASWSFRQKQIGNGWRFLEAAIKQARQSQDITSQLHLGLAYIASGREDLANSIAKEIMVHRKEFSSLHECDAKALVNLLILTGQNDIATKFLFDQSTWPLSSALEWLIEGNAKAKRYTEALDVIERAESMLRAALLARLCAWISPAFVCERLSERIGLMTCEWRESPKNLP